MDTWRYLATLRHHRRAFITIFALLAMSSGGTLLAHNAPTHFDVYDKPTTVAETQFQVGAVAENPSAYYESGEVLSNRTVFLLNSTPEATVWSKTTFSEEVETATHEISIRQTAKVQNNTFWTETKQLDSSVKKNTSSISTAEGMNMKEFKMETKRLEAPLSNDGTVESEIVVTTEFTLSDGEEYTVTRTYTIENSSNGIFYLSVPKHVESTTVKTSPSFRYTTLDGSSGTGTKALFGGSLFGILFFLALGQLTRFRGVSLVATPKGHWVRAIEDNSDWISEGTLTDLTELHLVELDSIDETITAAKNTTVPAVYDEEARVVAVFTSDTVYYCSGPGLEPEIVSDE